MTGQPSLESGSFRLFALIVLITASCLAPLASAQGSPTTTTLIASGSTITLGDTVIFTATVTGTGTPTGLVSFLDGTTPLGTGTLQNVAGQQQAAFSTSLLSAAATPHSITAVYQGDATNAGSTSSATSVTVSPRTSTTSPLVMNPSTVAVGQASTATVTVTDSGSVPLGTADTFATTGAPTTGRTGFTATLFADGLVLVAGGTGTTVLNTAEICSVSGGVFTATGNLNTARTGAVAVLLPNGKVLVAGGSTDGTVTGALNTAELFDPTAGTFKLAGSGNAAPNTNLMTAARFGATATLLNNGKVLIAGGTNNTGVAGVLSSAELYDPVADTFTATGNLNTARTGHSATLLSTGSLTDKVLIAGGSSDGTANGAISSAELFDPGAGTFTAITGANSTLSAIRWQPEAALLLSGKVLIAGGQNSGGAVTSADLYDPVANTFAASNSSMSQARANGSAVSLPDGMVLLAGGTTSQAVDLYDADNDKFDTTGSLQQSDNGLISTLLNNGDVLVVGLTTTLTSDAELYAPSFNPLGTVGVTSSEGSDGITGACVLTPSTATASTCTSTVTPSNVATNPHTITGTYPADAVHSTSNNTASLTVAKADTTATITANTPNPSHANQPITIAVSVTAKPPGAGTPTGSVVVSDGVGETCNIPSLTNGNGSCSLTPVASGTDTLTAQYNGDLNFNTSTSAGVSQTVNGRLTRTTVALIPTSVVVNQASTATITVTDIDPSGTAVTPTGTVPVTSDSADTITGTCTLAQTVVGTATCAVTVTPNTKGTGSHNITGSYSGSVMHTASSGSAALTVNTRHTHSVLSFSRNSSSVTAADVNQPTTATLTVTDDDTNGTAVTPAGTITFSSVVGSDVFSSTTCNLSGGGATASCSVTLTGESANPALHAISGAFPADTVHSTSSDTQNLTLNTRHTSGILSFSRGSAVTAADVNQPTTVTLTVTDDDTNGTALTPAGTIAFSSVVGSDVFSSPGCSLSGSGATASCSVTLTAASASPGSHGITGAFSVDSVHSASSNSQSVTVNTRHTTSTVTFSAEANTVAIATPVSVTAIVADDDSNGGALTPAGTVTFAFGNSTDKSSAGTCVLSAASGSTATCSITLTAANVGGGSHTVSISFPADTVHSASPGNSTLTVIPASTAIKIVSSSSAQNFLGQSAGLTATVQNTSPNSSAAPTGTVQFLLDGNPIGVPAALAGSGITSTAAITDDLSKLSPGSHKITAQYLPDQIAGSQNFVPSDSGTSGAGSNDVAVAVAAAINNIPGQTIAPVQSQFQSTGFTGSASFSCNVQLVGNPIPPGIQTNFPFCALDHTSGTLPATITATITTHAQSTSMVKPMFSNPASQRVAGLYALSTPLAGIFGALMLVGSVKKKYWSRRRLVVILGVVMMLAAVMLLSGCGASFSNPNNVQPGLTGATQSGQYVISVIGTDANGNTVAIATIPLNVQP